mgnify:CR=1 FL=1
MARLWPAWLRKAWPGAETWAGWSEVGLGLIRPDARCWGRLESRISPEGFAAALEQGEARSLEEVVAEILNAPQ